MAGASKCDVEKPHVHGYIVESFSNHFHSLPVYIQLARQMQLVNVCTRLSTVSINKRCLMTSLVIFPARTLSVGYMQLLLTKCRNNGHLEEETKRESNLEFKRRNLFVSFI